MKRIVTFLGVAVIVLAALPTWAQAQVVYVQPRTYVAPVIYPPPVVTSYYYAPSVAPARVTYSSYSYYTAPQSVVTYSAPGPVVTYSAPAPYVTYSAPATVLAPAPGYYETRTYYGLGIFRPRGYYTETYYRP